MTTTTDYYATLGVSREADADEIKKAFRRKARDVHPDTSDHHDAEERFKQLNAAYEVLSDPEKREMYDRYGTADPRATGFGGGGGFGAEDVFSGMAGDIFSAFFGGGAAGNTRPRMDGRDMSATVSVTLQEAATGTERELTYVRAAPCPTCSATGLGENGSVVTCPVCSGSGQVRTEKRTFFGTMQSVGPCQRCATTGTVVENACVTCQGTGRTRGQETVLVNVPIGARDGATVRLSGMGEAGVRGARAGDLIGSIDVQQHDFLVRDGDDLHARAKLSITQAALGGDVTVPGLLGPETVKVPGGAQNGDMVRVKRAGMPRTGSSVRGDLIVHLAVDVPRRLDRKQRKLLEELGVSLGDAKGAAPLDHVREWLGR